MKTNITILIVVLVSIGVGIHLFASKNVKTETKIDNRAEIINVTKTESDRIQNNHTGPGIHYKIPINTTDQLTSVSGKIFGNVSAHVQNITETYPGNWIITMDLVERNPHWEPGYDVPFWLNTEEKVENFHMNLETTVYRCGAGPDSNETTPDVPQEIFIFANEAKNLLEQTTINGNTYYYFDLNEENITSIYEQCLP